MKTFREFATIEDKFLLQRGRGKMVTRFKAGMVRAATRNTPACALL